MPDSHTCTLCKYVHTVILVCIGFLFLHISVRASHCHFGSKSAVDTMGKNKGDVCKWWPIGKCIRGARCRFIHDGWQRPALVPNAPRQSCHVGPISAPCRNQDPEKEGQGSASSEAESERGSKRSSVPASVAPKSPEAKPRRRRRQVKMQPKTTESKSSQPEQITVLEWDIKKREQELQSYANRTSYASFNSRDLFFLRKKKGNN